MIQNHQKMDSINKENRTNIIQNQYQFDKENTRQPEKNIRRDNNLRN